MACAAYGWKANVPMTAWIALGKLPSAPKLHWMWHRPASLASPAQLRICSELMVRMSAVAADVMEASLISPISSGKQCFTLLRISEEKSYASGRECLLHNKL